MDFVTDLPESTASGYTDILVVVDRLTKMAIYLPWRKDVDSLELVRMFFEEVICKQASQTISLPIEALNSRADSRIECAHICRIDHRLSNRRTGRPNGRIRHDGAVSSGFRYVRAGQLARSITVSRICLRTTTRCT
jgi:hypothetical protein